MHSSYCETDTDSTQQRSSAILWKIICGTSSNLKKKKLSQGLNFPVDKTSTCPSRSLHCCYHERKIPRQPINTEIYQRAALHGLLPDSTCKGPCILPIFFPEACKRACNPVSELETSTSVFRLGIFPFRPLWHFHWTRRDEYATLA